MKTSATNSRLKMTLLCLFFGVFGLHRFVMGHSNWWVMQLTFGGFGVWVIIDAVRIATGRLKMVHHENYIAV
ncbi:TM2 domain-containing protein [Flagellimonas marinaquae]